MNTTEIVEGLRDVGERTLSNVGFSVTGENAVAFGALLMNAADEIERLTLALSEEQRDAKRLRVLMRWGVRHSMEHPISDPTQPYYVCLQAKGHGSCTAHGATLAVVADRAIEWLESRGVNPESP